jgi:nucleoside-diphosphate-sugar epimerase
MRVLALGAKLLGKPEIFQSLCSSLQVDMSKTRDLLGWQPPIGVDEGLKRAVGASGVDALL